jgi:hypothetical protein
LQTNPGEAKRVAQAKDPYSNQGDSRDTPARQKLVALRQALLQLHKTLLEMERREYEKQNGNVSTGELFRLVVDDPQFSWLHNISEFVVGIDEALASDEGVMETDARVAVSLARKIFAPSESGDSFQKKYFDAIQSDPAVVMEHAELARLFNTEASEGENE